MRLVQTIIYTLYLIAVTCQIEDCQSVFGQLCDDVISLFN